MAVQFRPATTADLDALLPLVEEFHGLEKLPFDSQMDREVLLQLLIDNRLGQIILAVWEGETAGYTIITFGFSVEFRGRDAFIDELFVRPHLQGRGIGTRLLELAAEGCRAAGVKALHLEVDHTNSRAQALYTQFGFKDNQRYLLTRWIESSDIENLSESLKFAQS